MQQDVVDVVGCVAGEGGSALAEAILVVGDRVRMEEGPPLSPWFSCVREADVIAVVDGQSAVVGNHRDVGQGGQEHLRQLDRRADSEVVSEAWLGVCPGMVRGYWTTC